MPQRVAWKCCHTRAPTFPWPVVDSSSQCLVSPPSHRTRQQQQQSRGFAHLPGPLEAQRRMGRRRMTDIQLSTPTILPPIFNVSACADLTEWKWSPPSCLAIPGPPPPPPRPPGRITRWINELLDEDEEVLDLAPKQPPAEAALLHRVDKLVKRLNSGMAADRWMNQFNSLCQSLEYDLSSGQVSYNVVECIFTRISKALHTFYHRSYPHSSADGHWFSLCSSVVKGATSSTVQGPGCFSTQLWNAILYRLSGLAHTPAIADLFTLLMKNLPPEFMPNVSGGANAVLMELLQVRQVNMRQDTPAALDHVSYWSKKTAKTVLNLEATLLPASWSTSRAGHCRLHVSNAATAAYVYTNHLLAPFYYPDHSIVGKIAAEMKDTLHWPDPGLIQSITRYIRSETCFDVPDDRHMRYQWVLLLARLPHVPKAILFPVVRSLFREAQRKGSMTPTELCELLISHWISTSCLDHSELVRTRFDWGLHQHPSLAFLCRILCETQRSRNIRSRYYEMYKLIQYLGIRSILVKSFTHVHGQPFVDTLVSLIPAIEDDRVASQLRAILATMTSPHLGKQIWHNEVDGKTMNDRLMENLNHILLALRVPHTKRQPGKVRRIRRKNKLTPSKILAVEHIIMLLGDAPYKMNRIAFRAACRCLRFLRAYKRKPGPHILGSLYKLATASMKEGRPGRPSRVKYVCHLVETHHGKQSAETLSQAFLAARERILLDTRMRNAQEREDWINQRKYS